MSSNPAPEPAADFGARVREAQRLLGEGLTLAGFRRDPYRHLIEAESAVIGLFPELVAHMQASRQPVQDDQLRGAVIAGISAHTGQVTEAMKWRTALIGAGLLLGAMAVSAVGGCWQGYRTGYAEGHVEGAALGLQANAVIAQLPQAEGRVWEELIRDNPRISETWPECRRDAKPQYDRMARMLPVFIEGAKPATTITAKQ